MNQVNVFTAKPGMVLARHVKNKDGRHLMDAGTHLGEREIRILKMWGVLEITVRPGSGEAAEEIPAPSDGKINSFLAKWFSKNTLKDAVVKEIVLLAKDWYETHPGSLETLLGRIRASRESQKGDAGGESPDLPGLLSDNVKLPALPQIYSEINAATKDPKCSGKDIADIVSKDTGLSATLLKIINSAYYGFPEKIDSLAYAAMALGTRQICSLAMGITVINYFKGMPGAALDMEAFWRHSVGCGIMARNLATHVRGVNSERVFIGGLLHDMGRLVFLNHFPGVSGTVMAQAGKLNLSLHRIEPRYFGMGHAEFGSRLAQVWNFSPEISALIRDHHLEFETPPDKEVAMVYFSNWLVSALGIGFSGNTVLPKLNRRAWEAMEISPSALVPVIRQVDRQITEAVRFFYE
ncbi:MAG: HDOD domain-containing protein [Desulfobacterales bacterium]|nr:HDOD domain-containing protein [Desulfobacterales bacterium]